jgi:hypothetical protein
MNSLDGPDSMIAREFDNRYRDWKTFITTSDTCLLSSDDRPFIDNPPFRELVALGEAAIPLIVNQFFRDDLAHFLHHAMDELTGHRFDAEDIVAAERLFGRPLGNQARCAMWLGWWWKNKRAPHGGSQSELR